MFVCATKNSLNSRRFYHFIPYLIRLGQNSINKNTFNFIRILFQNEPTLISNIATIIFTVNRFHIHAFHWNRLFRSLTDGVKLRVAKYIRTNKTHVTFIQWCAFSKCGCVNNTKKFISEKKKNYFHSVLCSDDFLSFFSDLIIAGVHRCRNIIEWITENYFIFLFPQFFSWTSMLCVGMYAINVCVVVFSALSCQTNLPIRIVSLCELNWICNKTPGNENRIFAWIDNYPWNYCWQSYVNLHVSMAFIGFRIKQFA